MSTNNITVTQQPHQRSRFREYKRWLRVSLYSIFLLAGQCSATILGRLYFEMGGKSKWVAALLQSAGFPIMIPLLFYSSKRAILTNESNINDSSEIKPNLFIVSSCYLGLGLMSALMDLMYAYGLSYLPLSTFALVCSSQLAFNAVFTFFINSQKFTALIFNSVVLLTVSVSLLAINTESEDTEDLHLPKEKRIFGFFCALGASALFSLQHCLVQLCFEKVLKTEVYSAVLSMTFYPMLVALTGSTVGLFVSGDWKTLAVEMKEFGNGRVSYVMTVVWTALTWQMAGIGMLGLILEVSSLFSVVIGNLELTIAPILAVIVFHDKINGVKIIAFLLAIWGFLSYMYQHYLDDKKAKENKSGAIEVSNREVEI